MRIIRPYDYLLDANAGWRNLPLDPAHGITLADGHIRLRPFNDLLPPLAHPRGTFGGHTLPRGVAVWNNCKDPANPQLFFLDPAHNRVLWWRLCCGLQPVPGIGGRPVLPTPGSPADETCLHDFRPATIVNSRQLAHPSGLTIRQDHDLIVVDSGHRRVLVFTLPGFALSQIIVMDSWLPVDAAARGKTLFVLDGQVGTARVWKLDAQGRANPYYPGFLPEGFTPLRIQVDPEGWAYVVGYQGADASIIVFDPFGRALRGDAYDEAITLLPERLPPTPLSTDEQGYILLRSLENCPRPPLMTGILLDEQGYLEGTAIFVFPQPQKARFPKSGLFLTEPIDSRRSGNPWHRLALELDIPDRTGVNLYAFTSDILRPNLDAWGLLDEPPRLGGWQSAPDNADEWLIQSPPGRYLYLALVLKGPEDRTPSIERLYVYAHRRSSLRFLPAIYQEDDLSRQLLDRLLSLLDTVYGEIEDQIEQFPQVLDIAGAPADFLPWLASWFDLTLEVGWTELQQRTALKQVIELYAWRGTVKGLRLLIQLHTNLRDPQPRIIEHFRSTSEPAVQNWFGERGEDGEFHAVPDAAHHFTVVLPARVIDTPDKSAALGRLIDANKPAHTHYTLRPVYPGIWLGGEQTRASALGVDTLLGSPRQWRLQDDQDQPQPVPALVLPDDAVPVARLEQGKLNRTRLGRS